MMIELQLWHLISLLLSFFAFVAGIARYLLAQTEKRQIERDDAQDNRWHAALRGTETQLSRIEAELKSVNAENKLLERSVMELKAELPLNYVRREDYLRGQSVLEAKIDGLAVRMENMFLKEGRQNVV